MFCTNLSLTAFLQLSDADEYVISAVDYIVGCHTEFFCLFVIGLQLFAGESHDIEVVSVVGQEVFHELSVKFQVVPVDGGGDSGLDDHGGLPELSAVDLVADLAEELTVPALAVVVGGVVEGVTAVEISHKDHGFGSIELVGQSVPDLMHDDRLVVVALIVEREEAVKMGGLPPGDEEQQDEAAAAQKYAEALVFQDAAVDPVIKAFGMQIKDEGAEDHQGDGCPVVHHGSLYERNQKERYADADAEKNGERRPVFESQDKAADSEKHGTYDKDRDGEIDQCGGAVVDQDSLEEGDKLTADLSVFPAYAGISCVLEFEPHNAHDPVADDKAEDKGDEEGDCKADAFKEPGGLPAPCGPADAIAVKQDDQDGCHIDRSDGFRAGYDGRQQHAGCQERAGLCRDGFRTSGQDHQQEHETAEIVTRDYDRASAGKFPDLADDRVSDK